MLQTNYFTEEELLIIWEKAAEYFALNEYAERFDSKNTRNKIYCADTHRAISLCAKRLGYNTLEEKMKERAPLEYAQERLIHPCIVVLFQVGGMNRSIMQTWRTSLIM